VLTVLATLAAPKIGPLVVIQALDGGALVATGLLEGGGLVVTQALLDDGGLVVCANAAADTSESARMNFRACRQILLSFIVDSSLNAERPVTHFQQRLARP
jgi:hypothetical protein